MTSAIQKGHQSMRAALTTRGRNMEIIHKMFKFKEEPSQFSMGQTAQSITWRNHVQGRVNVREYYSCALDQGTMVAGRLA